MAEKRLEPALWRACLRLTVTSRPLTSRHRPRRRPRALLRAAASETLTPAGSGDEVRRTMTTSGSVSSSPAERGGVQIRAAAAARPGGEESRRRRSEEGRAGSARPRGRRHRRSRYLATRAAVPPSRSSPSGPDKERRGRAVRRRAPPWSRVRESLIVVHMLRSASPTSVSPGSSLPCRFGMRRRHCPRRRSSPARWGKRGEGEELEVEAASELAGVCAFLPAVLAPCRLPSWSVACEENG
uniref:Uncharacterized protein n=1 Tax=Oryza glumipatula TaxID=40148 RepID=A0A0E0BRT5_9ORYZ